MSLSACQSATAMSAQLFANRSPFELSEAWGQGVSELYLEIAQFGQLSASMSLEFEQDASGVYSYDVDEEFGDYLAQEILAGSYDFQKAKGKLRELIWGFYQVDMPPVPS
jgi:hypothetical protein